jgi:raffinose/stachyose/melibiose transport system substrate-binding protein
VPTTYAEVEQACQTLKQQDIYALSLGGKFGWNTMRLTDYFLEMIAGPELHDQLDRLEERWDRPEVVAAYELLRKWVEQGWIVPDFLNVEPNDARLPWYQGAAAMVFEGDWMERSIKSDEQDIAKFDFFLPPTGHEPLRYSAFPEQIMIAKTSLHPDAAAEFIDWWISPEVQTKFLQELGGVTATIGVAADPNEWPLLHKWNQILESNRATYPPTDTVFEKELMDAFFEVQDGVIAGQFSPEEGATLMQERAEEWKARTS